MHVLVESLGLISKIDTAYHTTHHRDQTIADNISGSGTPTTRNQVKRIRLAHNWRRRGDDDDQLAASRAETFTLVEQALQQGAVRCFEPFCGSGTNTRHGRMMSVMRW